MRPTHLNRPLPRVVQPEDFAGYTAVQLMDVALVQVGDVRQFAFLDWAQRELLPALLELG